MKSGTVSLSPEALRAVKRRRSLRPSSSSSTDQILSLTRREGADDNNINITTSKTSRTRSSKRSVNSSNSSDSAASMTSGTPQRKNKRRRKLPPAMKSVQSYTCSSGSNAEFDHDGGEENDEGATRSNDPAAEDATLSITDTIPDDTTVAMEILRRLLLRSPLFALQRARANRLGVTAGVVHLMPPLVLKHMLYATVGPRTNNRTTVEQTVDLMLHKRQLRQIRLPAGSGFVCPENNVKGSGTVIESRHFVSRGRVHQQQQQQLHTVAIGLVMMDDYIRCLDDIVEWYYKLERQRQQNPVQQFNISIGSSDRYDEHYEMDDDIWAASAALQQRIQRQKQQQQQKEQSQSQSSPTAHRAKSRYVDAVPLSQSSTSVAPQLNGQSPLNEMESNTLRHIIQRFKEKLIPQCNEMSVSRTVVMQVLGVTDRQMTQLIRFGLFTIRDSNSFWFSLPNLGTLLQNVQDGREEITKALKRKKYKEMMLHQLIRGPFLKKSNLNIEFHVKELLGSGVCEVVNTTHGEMVTLKL